jgi:hypothetical protein
MERRAASHTEEEEMNQRRRLLNLARKGDPKAISKLFELYQVRVFSGEMLVKLNRAVKNSIAQDKAGHRKAGPRSKAKPTAARKATPVRMKKASPKRAKARPKHKPKPAKKMANRTKRKGRRR